MSIRIKVAVNVVYHVYRIADSFRYQVSGKAHLYQQGNMAMSYIVDSYPLNAGGFATILHCREKLASRQGENAFRRTGVIKASHIIFEFIRKKRRNRHGSDTSRSFRRCEYIAPLYSAIGLGHADCICFQVYIAEGEGKKLPAAQASVIERLKGHALGQLIHMPYKSRKLFQRPEIHFICLDFPD